MRDRFLAWLVCGPLGHFVAGVIDVTAIWARYWRDRALGSNRAPT